MKTSKINYTVLVAVFLIILGGVVAAFTGLKVMNLVQEARKLDLTTMNYNTYVCQMDKIRDQISSQFAVIFGAVLGMGTGLSILGFISQKKKAKKLQDQINSSVE